MILWRNWGGWHALNVFFFFASSRVTSESSMHVAFTLMRGNSKSDTESFRIALKRKVTKEKTTRHWGQLFLLQNLRWNVYWRLSCVIADVIKSCMFTSLDHILIVPLKCGLLIKRLYNIGRRSLWLGIGFLTKNVWIRLHSFFYKNIFYKNIEAEICEILRIS